MLNWLGYLVVSNNNLLQGSTTNSNGAFWGSNIFLVTTFWEVATLFGLPCIWVPRVAPAARAPRIRRGGFFFASPVRASNPMKEMGMGLLLNF